MCTLIAAVGQFPSHPLVVAANRDERLDRAASPPRLWAPPGKVPFLAPKDEVAGGSWLGFNASGVFVGITNRFGIPADASKRSRGMLVLDALGAGTASEIHAAFGRLRGADYNPFHLLYADRKSAYVTWFDGSALRQDILGPGVHVVTERSLGGDDKARTERVRASWPEIAKDREPSVQKIQELMRQHGTDPLMGPCIHLPAFRFATRSSFILVAGTAERDVRLWWADQAPCTVPYVEQPDWLEALFRASPGAPRGRAGSTG